MGGKEGRNTEIYLVRGMAHRVHTEWQLPISVVYSIMMEKSALAGEGGGARPPPFALITLAYTKLKCTLQLRGQIYSVFHLYCSMWNSYVLYSTVLHLPSLKFRCVGGDCDRTPGLLQLRHWQSDALTTQLDLIHAICTLWFGPKALYLL